MTVSAWTSLLTNPGSPQVTFAIIRLFNYNGTIESHAGFSMANAYAAGIRDISGYIYPCVSGSVFAVNGGVTCNTPQKQMDMILKYLQVNGLNYSYHIDGTHDPTMPPTGQPTGQPSSHPTYFNVSGKGNHTRSPAYKPTRKPTRLPTGQPTGQPSSHPLTSKPTCRPTASPTKEPTASPTFKPTALPLSPTSQPTRQPSNQPSSSPTGFPSSRPTAEPTNTALRTSVSLKRIWVMVEDENPRQFWARNSSINCEYLKQLHRAAFANNIQLGIYTTSLDWSNIIEDGIPGRCEYPFETLPLWTPKFDSTPNMDFFYPFGGWTRPYLKQITGGSIEMRRVGSTRICYNYRDESLNSFDLSTSVIEPI